MRLDHLSYAAGPDGLDATARRLGGLLGAEFVDGGFHPRFGTRNRILPLTDRHYLEVVGALDHPAVDEVPFGQAVKARTESGGGWLGWVVAVDDLAPVEARLGRPAAPGHRTRPDGVELNWHQLGVRGLMNDPQLPFFVRWDSPPADHPSQGGSDGGAAEPGHRRRPAAGRRLARRTGRTPAGGRRGQLDRAQRPARPAVGDLPHAERRGHRLTDRTVTSAAVPRRPSPCWSGRA